MEKDLVENLGNVRLPQSLRTLLDERCKRQNRTKSDITRSALCLFLRVDVGVVVDHMVLTQRENNGHDGEQESADEKVAIEKATRLKRTIMGPV